MQITVWLLMAADYVRPQLATVIAQTTIWSDRLYWNGYGPLAEAGILFTAVAAAGLCMLAHADEKDVEIWSTLTVAGRWMGAIAVVVVTLAVCAGGHRAA